MALALGPPAGKVGLVLRDWEWASLGCRMGSGLARGVGWSWASRERCWQSGMGPWTLGGDDPRPPLPQSGEDREADSCRPLTHPHLHVQAPAMRGHAHTDSASSGPPLQPPGDSDKAGWANRCVGGGRTCSGETQLRHLTLFLSDTVMQVQ